MNTTFFSIFVGGFYEKMRIIYIVLNKIGIPHCAIYAAMRMGKAFSQEVRWLSLDGTQPPPIDEKLRCDTISPNQLADKLEQNDASMLIFELNENPSTRLVQQLLNLTRNLRIPYLFIKSNQNFHFSNVALTVSFLEEDKEKAAFAAAFGRQLTSRLTIISANDYGDKATQHANAIATLFDSLSIKYSRKKSKKDSFGIDKEVVKEALAQNFDLIIVSASREYGIDDWIFGPKERHLIKQSQVPLLIINPRGDLYALCD